MKARWAQLGARFNGLQTRERWLVTLAVLAAIVLLGFAVFVDPVLQRGRQAERVAAEQATQLAALQSQQLQMQSSAHDPEVQARAELEALRKQLDESAGRLASLEHSLVPPQRMSNLLENMLGQRSGLRLLGLKTLAVTPLLERKPHGDESTNSATEASVQPERVGGGLYKHGVEIRLEGSYQELTAYLRRLEQSPLKLLWSQASLAAEAHPRLVLTLTVYTLSLDRAWLIV